MKTIIPVLLVFAAVDLFLRKPEIKEEIGVFSELKSKNIGELQIYLDEAVLAEKYEYACVLHDLINLKKEYGNTI